MELNHKPQRFTFYLKKATSKSLAAGRRATPPCHETDDAAWEFVVAPNFDVCVVAKSGTRLNTTKIRVVSKEGDYQSFSPLQKAIKLSTTFVN